MSKNYWTIKSYARLSKEAAVYLESLQDKVPFENLPIEKARASMRNGQKAEFSDYPVSTARVETQACPVYVVKPLSVKQMLPVTFYLHGGGWMLGDIKTHTRIVCELALRSQSAIVFIEYPLVPHNIFPIPLESSFKAIQEILDHAPEWKLDARRYTIAGDSSGGNLTAACSLLAIQRSSRLPLCQVLLYPPVAYSFTTESYIDFAYNPNLSLKTMQWFWNSYLGETSRGDEPLASPLLASSSWLRKMPTTFILSCEYDILRDEVEEFARLLLASGVEVVALRWLGALHGFLVDEHLSRTTSADACLDLIGKYLQNAYATAERESIPVE